MKVYISADIEGVAGITHWNEARKSEPDYLEFRRRMTAETVAACEGAIAAGADEILIKDAHGTGRNIEAEALPACARLIRGWSGSPLAMVQELDASFSAVLMIGYHAKAGSADNPLAHTLSLDVQRIVLNGELLSEFLMHTYAAALFEVPVAFLSGDSGIVADVQALNPAIATLATSTGIGESTVSMAPVHARERIRAGVEQALRRDLAACRVALPDRFAVEIHYRKPTSAERTAHYPGARRTGACSIGFECEHYYEVLRLILFTVLGRI